MKLFFNNASPFVRKARVFARETGLDKKIEEITTVVSPVQENPTLAQANPLKKIPALVLDDGTTLFDSRVIVEYLDTVSPVSRLIPEPNRQRIVVKRWEALADGVCDAAVAIVLEGKRPARQQNKDWLDRQRGKIDLGLKELGEELGERAWCNGEAYSLADIATGCVLAYLDLRHTAIDWRAAYPNLVKLAEKLAKRPSFAETAPPAS